MQTNCKAVFLAHSAGFCYICRKNDRTMRRFLILLGAVLLLVACNREQKSRPPFSLNGAWTLQQAESPEGHLFTFSPVSETYLRIYNGDSAVYEYSYTQTAEALVVAPEGKTTVTLIDKGVLKTHWLSLYGSKKTGRPVVKNTGGDLVIEPGDKTLEELIASVDKGLLMGGFSGGQPGTNGEFSGVAKNSFLIENGRVTRAVTETMINGNLGDMLRHVRGISRERDVQGVFTLPYLAVDGIVISGK